jgi:hypothetical protein
MQEAILWLDISQGREAASSDFPTLNLMTLCDIVIITLPPIERTATRHASHRTVF